MSDWLTSQPADSALLCRPNLRLVSQDESYSLAKSSKSLIRVHQASTKVGLSHSSDDSIHLRKGSLLPSSPRGCSFQERLTLPPYPPHAVPQHSTRSLPSQQGANSAQRDGVKGGKAAGKGGKAADDRSSMLGETIITEAPQAGDSMSSAGSSSDEDASLPPLLYSGRHLRSPINHIAAVRFACCAACLLSATGSATAMLQVRHTRTHARTHACRTQRACVRAAHNPRQAVCY